ncbi:MAG: T9SS type A sorting domain-containing protein [Muribaculaceae bacterium]|nr:T9SS type A sorting domain-containing protein [Muribaculaceae bacterium]
MTRRFIITTAICCLLLALPAHAGAKGWEPVKTERSDTRSVVRTSEIEILAAKGVILVATSSQVSVKVFTILGQPIAQATLQPGTHQLQLPAHGIYIVKVGDLTCKVAV